MSARPETLPQGTVTFLFTDIEASTRLLERLGRDAYGELLQIHRTLLRDAVAVSGGVEVDEQGDALLAVFTSAAAAVTAAVSAQRALAEQSWPEGVELRVRMGVHTGEATLTGDRYVGIAVHRGRRVCEAAYGGQVVLSSATRTVLGSELPAGIELGDLGEVRLAGFDEPERLFQVVAEGLPAAFAEPRAQRPWRDEQPALLERAEELAAVDAATAGAQVGAGRFVIIEGPAGIGKTSVLAEGRTRAAASGLTVLQARGSELESAFSFGAVRQLFETKIAQASAEARAGLLGGAAAQAGRLFAESTDGAEEDVYPLLHGLYWLTVNLAEERPLLLAVDDLQWADPPSLRWLAYLARRLEGLPVSVLATLRPLEDEHPLLAELLVDPATTVIRPPALSAPSVAELVREELSSEADDEFCLACHRATGGNPLLLRELIRTLAAEDVSATAASAGVVERLAPDAVTRSVRLRLDRVQPEAAALARAVAILGDGAEREHAAAVAELERRALAPAAAALARLDLLHPEPPFAFVHPLIRNAVYESVPVHERELAHARAATLLRELGAPPARVAAQLLRAPAESVPDTAAILREAAEHAAAEAGLESAVSYLTRALEEPVDDDERSQLLLELADAEARLGVPTVIPHLREARSLARDHERRGEAALALGHALYWAGDEEEGVEELQQALDELTEISDDLRLRLEAELMVNSFRLPSGYEAARRRVAAIDVGPDDGPAARLILGMRAYSIGTGGGGGTRADAVALAHQALAAMPPDELAWNYTAGIYALMWADALDEALGFLDEGIAEVRRRGAILQFSSLSMTRALIQYTRGALLEAEADGRAALAAMPHEHVWFVPHAHAWLAQILVERGSVEEAAELVARVAEPSDPFSKAPLHRAKALIAAARGEHRVALEQALALGAALTAFGHTTSAASVPPWRSLAALAHHALGEDEQALELARQDVELARMWGAPRTLGRGLRILGLIEAGDEGLGRIRESVAVLADSPARLEHAYALTNLGGALRRANHRAEAREPLRQALELAQRSGAVLLAEDAHEELIAAGARPRRIVQSGAAALTPSERRIAAMAAEGLSNRDIAQALFVTLRTVEMHLSNAFRKLNIASRTQLPAALAESDAPVAASA